MLNWMLKSRVASLTPKPHLKSYRALQVDRPYSKSYNKSRTADKKDEHFSAGFSLGILTLALMLGKLKYKSEGMRELSFKSTEAEALTKDSLGSELQPGHKEKLTVFLVYDSRVATQRESLDKMHRDALAEWLVSNTSNKNLNVVKVDVSQEQLPSSFPLSKAKV